MWAQAKFPTIKSENIICREMVIETWIFKIWNSHKIYDQAGKSQAIISEEKPPLSQKQTTKLQIKGKDSSESSIKLENKNYKLEIPK
jgi:hypothetical protein